MAVHANRPESLWTQPLTMPEVAEAAGLEYATLHSWVKKELIKPSLRLATGNGRASLFSGCDLLTIKILVDLREAGVRLSALSNVVETIRANPLDGAEFLIINGSVDVIDGSVSLRSAVADGKAATIYPVTWAFDSITAWLHERSSEV